MLLNAIGGEKFPDFIGSVYAALSKASIQGVEPPKAELKPAISVKKWDREKQTRTAAKGSRK